MTKVKLIKIKSLLDKPHPNRVEEGFIVIGKDIELPKVGKKYMLTCALGFWKTSTVLEILSPNKFRTKNSIYQWERLEDFKKNDLVLLRVPNEPELKERQRHYNIWVRVLFRDEVESIGRLERCPSFAQGGFYANQIGDMITFNNNHVLEIFNKNDNKDWCYSDNVTRCNCSGLCRNK